MSFTISVTGQILIHGPLDPATPGAEPVRDLLHAHAAMANLEATVEAPGAWPTKVKTLHLASPDALHCVRALGFTAVGHANNHAFDLGPPGIAATRAAAEAAGLKLAGSGMSLQQALSPVVLQPAGAPAVAFFSVDLGPQQEIVYAAQDRAGIAPLRVRRAVALPPSDYAALSGIVSALGDDRRKAARDKVGYNGASEAQGFDAFGTDIVEGDTVAPVWRTDAADRCRLLAEMLAARSAGEFVVVALHCHHWDADWTRTPDWLTELGADLIDNGAGLVFCTGAPLLQGMTFHKGRPILGGLGNFVFHTNRAQTYDTTGLDVWRSMAARLTFADDGTCLDIEALPVAVGRPAQDGALPPAPVPLSGADADEIMSRFTGRLSPDERSLVRGFR